MALPGAPLTVIAPSGAGSRPPNSPPPVGAGSASSWRPNPSPEVHTDATRHLSAGAYLDPQFCLSALGEIYYQPRRIVAPSYGCDPIAVLGHCLRARRAMVVRDALLIGLLLLGSWLSFAATVLALVALLTLHLSQVSIRVVREAVAYVVDGGYFQDPATAGERRPEDPVSGRRRGPGHAGGRPPPRRFVRLWFENVLAQVVARSIGIVFSYLVLLVVVLLLATWVWHTAPLGGTRMGVQLRDAFAGLTGLALLVPAAMRAWNRIQLHALLPNRVPWRPLWTRRLAELDKQLHGNTVVYSGLRPFVGAGEVIRSWVLTQRLVRAPHPTDKLTAPVAEGRREFAMPPFTARQLSEHVHRYLSDLAEDLVPERRLAGLTVDDRIFVAGTEISDLWPFTPASLIADIIANPTAPARHYLQCQVVSWRGELVTTVYVHFAVQGRALYVELNVLGLAPCDERFRIIDQVGGTSVGRLLADTASGALSAPALLATAPRRLARAAADFITVTMAELFRTRVRKGYDYGARVSLREIGAAGTGREPMQSQDNVKYGRMVERRVLAAVLDFLQDRGVDVSEYRQHSFTIMGGAFATNGGTVNIGGDSVGFQHNEGTSGGSEQ